MAQFKLIMTLANHDTIEGVYGSLLSAGYAASNYQEMSVKCGLVPVISIRIVDVELSAKGWDKV